MADVVVFGIDVLDSPSVSTLSGAGNDGQGTVTITGGTQPFEDDDIVVFSAVNLTADGEIQGGGGIDNLTVYDSRADYEAGIVKYNYDPQNPGQTADVQGDVSGLGDGYVSFNANILIPQDGGPFLSRLFVAPGTDLADSSGQPGGLTLDRNEDIDHNGDGDFNDPLEDGNNLFYTGDYTIPVICFTTGTLIRTPSGDVPIESLCPGDRVLTFDDGAQPIRWIGRRRLRATGRMAPVAIAAGTFDNFDELKVSQNHRILRTGPAIAMLFEYPEVLVAAKHLVDGRSIRIQSGGWVEYMHILFDRHQLIWANGQPCESLFPSLSNLDPTIEPSMAELKLLFPALFDVEGPSHNSQTARRCLKRAEAILLTATR